MIYRQKTHDADGQTDRQTDRHADGQTDRVAHRVALQLLLGAQLITKIEKNHKLGDMKLI